MANIVTERIAVSSEGRAVTLVKATTSPTFGSDPSKLRVMLFAQQHGDEPSGREALLMLLSKAFSGKLDSLLARIDLLIIPQVNPDGSQKRQRRTASGIDLNRAHVLLNSPEVRALHDLFHAWMPHVTVDLHEYSSFNPAWVESGVIRTADVQLGMLTNLNCAPELRWYQRDRMLPFVAEAMHRQGFHFHEYIVGSPAAGVRHSTTEINDGRQSFGMFNTLSFLQEGRKWRNFDEKLERRSQSQLASVEALLQYCMDNAREMCELVTAARGRLGKSAGEQAILRMDHVANGGTLLIPGRDLKRERETLVALSPYCNTVTPLETVTLPSAYIVPAEQRSIAGLLASHHVRITPVTGTRTVTAASYNIDGISVETLEGEEIVKPFIHEEVTDLNLKPGDLIVPTNQLHALWLATMLEPGSMWGLSRYREFREVLENQEIFPVSRLMAPVP